MTKTKSLILTGLFAALTAAGAFIRVPMWPVGITLQVLVTALSGMLLGGRMGAASQAIYLLIGLAGVPVFSEGGGIGYIARPSFGFLVGLMPMAFVIGTLARKRDGLPGLFAAGLAGVATLYAVGIPYMYIAVNVFMGTRMSLWTAVSTGMLVFLPGDLIKILAAALILRRILRWTDKPPA